MKVRGNWVWSVIKHRNIIANLFEGNYNNIWTTSKALFWFLYCYPSKDKCCRRIETSQLFCRPDQLTRFQNVLAYLSQVSLPNRNQFIGFLCNSIDWFYLMKPEALITSFKVLPRDLYNIFDVLQKDIKKIWAQLSFIKILYERSLLWESGNELFH